MTVDTFINLWCLFAKQVCGGHGTVRVSPYLIGTCHVIEQSDNKSLEKLTLTDGGQAIFHELISATSLDAVQCKGGKYWVGASLGTFDPFCNLFHEMKTKTYQTSQSITMMWWIEVRYGACSWEAQLIEHRTQSRVSSLVLLFTLEVFSFTPIAGCLAV